MAVFRPRFQRQIGDNTTTFDGFICTMTSGAMALDYQTRGAVRLSGGQMLKHSGLKDADITDNGTNLRDLERAWKGVSEKLKIPSIKLQVRQNGFDDVLKALAAGRAVVLQGDYRRLGRANRCQEIPVVKGHALVLLPERSGNKILVGDPLCRAFKFIPQSDLEAFAHALGSKAHVFHANSQVPIGDKAAAKKVPPAPVVDERIIPSRDGPVAICDVGPTTIFSDPTGTTKVGAFRGASAVGLYARPLPGAPKLFAAIRIDMKGGPKEDLHVMWVPDAAVSNVRLP
ncbi:MAG: hypothetical protein ACJ767_10190 [Chloroflexota bacterium]